MFDSFGKLVENTFTRFSYPKLFSLLTVFGLIALIVIGLEYYTQYGYHLRLNNKIEVLIKLNKLSNNNIKSNPELYPLYKELLTEIKSNDSNGFNIETLFLSDFFNKFWSALLIPLLIAVIGWFASEKKERKKNLGGMIIFMIISLLFGLLVPSFENIRINIALNIIFSFLIIFAATKYTD